MYTITINHKDKGTVHYTVYSKEEADSKGLLYSSWREAQIGDYALSDDNMVAEVIQRKEYSHKEGKKTTYIRMPWGYALCNPSYNSNHYAIKGRTTASTLTGKPAELVRANSREMKDLAMTYAFTMDIEKTLEIAFANKPLPKWKKTDLRKRMRTKVFRDMVTKELKARLQDHGIDEDFALNLLKDAIDIAKDKKDVSSLLRGVENIQDMLGMKEKTKVTSTKQIEASSTQELLDEINKQETVLTETTKVENG
jgi:hypothetical protein